MTASKTTNDNGASKTTSFSARALFLLVPATMTFVLGALGYPCHVAATPYLLMAIRMVQSEPGETRIQFWTKYTVMTLVYCGFLVSFASLVATPFFGPRLTGFHALSLYLPMYTISMRDPMDQYGPVGTFVVQNFFDRPLVIAGYICREVFGVRMLAPFCNILDGAIVQGSMPFPSDIPTLASEPYNVGLIVNMCREYGGALAEMKACGIVQCHLPHQDTTAPSYESLVSGCARIRQFRKDNPDKRVYIHCKGGIARASTMTLAHYVHNEGKDPAVAMQAMKAKRRVVYTRVQDFPGIVKLNEERLRNNKDRQEREQNEPMASRKGN